MTFIAVTVLNSEPFLIQNFLSIRPFSTISNSALAVRARGVESLSNKALIRCLINCRGETHLETHFLITRISRCICMVLSSSQPDMSYREENENFLTIYIPSINELLHTRHITIGDNNPLIKKEKYPEIVDMPCMPTVNQQRRKKLRHTFLT